ncbi:MAG: hypothetical protein KGL95_14990, partial [Patescibacteria group bacterium]|nr:hypothetical protein [Patescibacteria group bacterium]
PNPTPPPNITGTYMGSGEDNTLQTMDQLELNEHPDIYLNNRCPYSGANFSVSSDFADTADPHYFFVVILSDSNTNLAKNNFINWALSTGLSKTQIEHLDIIYQ